MRSEGTPAAAPGSTTRAACARPPAAAARPATWLTKSGSASRGPPNFLFPSSLFPLPRHHGRTPRYERPPSPSDRTLRTPVTRAAAASSSYSRSETPVITRISVGADSSCTSPGRPRRRSSSSRTAGTSPSLARFTSALAMARMSASVTASRRRSTRAGSAWQSSISLPKYGRSLRFRAKHALGLGT